MATKKKTTRTTKSTRATKKPTSSKAKAMTKATSATRKKPAAAIVSPSLFRINVEVGDVSRAAQDWGALLGLDGRPQAGARVYFTTGSVTLQVVQCNPPHPAAKALYFLVDDLESVHTRAKQLGWLSKDLVHGQVGGEISVRPWGERSFYAEDAWGNPLCFVQAGTVYPG
jgi:hypothetical protein